MRILLNHKEQVIGNARSVQKQTETNNKYAENHLGSIQRQTTKANDNKQREKK